MEETIFSPSYFWLRGFSTAVGIKLVSCIKLGMVMCLCSHREVGERETGESSELHRRASLTAEKNKTQTYLFFSRWKAETHC